MEKSRRYFLMTLAALSPLALHGVSSLGQTTGKRTPFPTPPPSAETQNPAEMQASKQQDSQAARKAALQHNEKEFRAGVARLYELTNELKQDVDKTSTADVFSVQMYKRMEEIAKLAKQLQAKAKG
ncbi:MAG TPA: hypothetical protein VE077_11295 [Candidatus Methylomirabilis sp.]|nr:hypothetical protein [Candidatus Methylomirabilis sp.]